MIETKLCRKCNIEKSVTDFSKNRGKKDGLQTQCKKCHKQYEEDNEERLKLTRKKYYKEHIEQSRAYRKEHYNKEDTKQYNQQYYEANQENLRAYSRQYYNDEKNKEAILAYSKKYQEKHRTENVKRCRKYYQKNRKQLLASAKLHQKLPDVKAARAKYQKQYYIDNKLTLQENGKEWRKNNKESIKKKKHLYNRLPETKARANKKHKVKWAADPMFRLKYGIGNQMSVSLKGVKAGRQWENLVGYTLTQLVKHLEKQFIKGMVWENYGKGGWVIDHIIPRKVFNFTKPEHVDFQKCWALKNLQPMWEHDNQVKNCRLTKHFQPSLLM